MNNSQTSSKSPQKPFKLPPSYHQIETLSTSSNITLIQLDTLRKKMVCKFFPLVDDEMNPLYENEVRFADLTHPNIITPKYWIDKRTFQREDETSESGSLIFTEYAPNGSFSRFFSPQRRSYDTKLARTYFHELITAIEYLNFKGLAHMNLTLEKLFFGESFELKIADLTLAHDEEDEDYLGDGTPHYRSPELRFDFMQDFSPHKCDIYSAGIILFAMAAGGCLPFFEEDNGNPLYDDLRWSPKFFWIKHERLQNKPKDFWSKGFTELFEGLCCYDPKKRYSIADIRKNKWFNGAIYSDKEKYELMKKLSKKA